MENMFDILNSHLEESVKKVGLTTNDIRITENHFEKVVNIRTADNYILAEIRYEPGVYLFNYINYDYYMGSCNNLDNFIKKQPGDPTVDFLSSSEEVLVEALDCILKDYTELKEKGVEFKVNN